MKWVKEIIQSTIIKVISTIIILLIIILVLVIELQNNLEFLQ
jgi:hypothetical protein